MPLGTLDRTPPPFFRQGPSALSKLIFFSAAAVFLMVGDTRFKWTEPLRAGMANVLGPVQKALAVPVEMWEGGEDYLRGLRQAQASEAALRKEVAALSVKAARGEQLGRENEQLRSLLELRKAIALRSQPAEVLYEAADPFTRKLIISSGTRDGVQRGAPVLNQAGVLGQVTQAYAMTAEVTLLADKDAAIPVLNTRTQQRGAAFGGGRPGAGTMELRYTSANADVKVGDELQTSGLDGVYPPGLPVARVTDVERRVESGFARITLTPVAQPDGVRHVLVIEPVGVQLPPRPEPVVVEPAAKGERQLKTPKRASGNGASGVAP